MKAVASNTVFQPVTLTLDTEAEVRFIRDVIGATGNRVDNAYGMDTSQTYETFKFLNVICDAFNIERPDVSINIAVN